MIKKTKAYKAFDKDLKCKEFQYEIGKTYHHDGIIKICESGYHACLNPFDVLNYYDFCESRYCEVEIIGDFQTHSDDSKICGSDIKIIKELSEKEFNLVYINYLISECEKENKQSGNYSKQSQSGNPETGTKKQFAECRKLAAIQVLGIKL